MKKLELKKFLVKIKTLTLANKANIAVAALSVFLLSTLIYQYVDYHIFQVPKNVELALKNQQRVVIDLNEQILPNKDLSENADATIKKTGDVAFATDGKTPAVSPEVSSTVAAAEKLEPTAEVAIIIANLGLNDEALKTISTMSKEFTLAFSPYGQLTTKSSIAMSEEGFVVLAEIPMDSLIKREDAGRFGISSSNEDFKNKQNIDAITSIVPSATGILTPSEEDFSEQTRFDAILKQIQSKNLGLVYYGRAMKRIKDYSAKNGLETAYPELTIDEQATPENIAAQLRALELLAQDTGFAVGVARPYPITLDALAAWEKTLKDKKIVLIPAISR